MGGRNSHQRVGRRARLADHFEVVLHREQLVHTPADHLMVVEKKYSDFSFFAHGVSLTHDLSGRPGRTLPVPGVTGITCRCSGPLPGCNQCSDQRLFPIGAKYLEVRVESTRKSKQKRRSGGVSQKCGALGNVLCAGRSPGHLSRLFPAERTHPVRGYGDQASRTGHPATPGTGPTEEHT
ncbi:hypothetical protein GCM10010306_054630 [Streptomyces umbrinus]|nr:hypothetical protein GCM10010306_054630 [Streptomyces umbrinus]